VTVAAIAARNAAEAVGTLMVVCDGICFSRESSQAVDFVFVCLARIWLKSP
jgi:hypothetical protein